MASNSGGSILRASLPFTPYLSASLMFSSIDFFLVFFKKKKVTLPECGMVPSKRSEILPWTFEFFKYSDVVFLWSKLAGDQVHKCE